MGNEKNQHVKDKNRIDWTIIEFEKIFKEKGSIAYLWEKNYNWNIGYAYECTKCNGKEFCIFTFETNDIKKDSKKLAKKIYEKSKNFSGWRYLYMESTISGYMIQLFGGWYDGYWPEPPKIIN